MNFTEQEKDLLKCAFNVATLDCPDCANKGGRCSERFFDEMGQEILIKLGIIPFKMIEKSS